ncbi:MAG: CD225/dispanin family protein [Pirellulaceae bacterium]
MSYGENPYEPGKPIPDGTVKNYLTEAIICLLCCGGLFAIPALIFATQVNSKLAQGDYHGAVEASNNAKKWCIIAVCIGVVCGGLGAGIQILAIAAQNA